jgi:hypothetical protein
MPDSIGGSHMASLIGNPDIIEFMDAIKVQGHSGVNIETISFSELPEEFRNKTIGQLEAKRITGVTIIGFKTPDELFWNWQFTDNPLDETSRSYNKAITVFDNTFEI